MHIPRVRLRKEYRLKVWLTIISLVIIGFVFIPHSNRSMMRAYFSVRCKNYQQQNFSKKLNDRIVDYSSQAKATGIAICGNRKEVEKRVSAHKLFKVRSGSLYVVDDMTHSYPYLTRDSKRLLEEIGARLKDKIAKDGLKGSKIHVTSMMRTTEKLKGLRRTNGNVSDNSPHLYGNAFDISYARFTFRKVYVTECDKWYMKESLAEVIWQLRQEKKCWATYEKQQGCFHIVSR